MYEGGRGLIETHESVQGGGAGGKGVQKWPKLSVRTF